MTQTEGSEDGAGRRPFTAAASNGEKMLLLLHQISYPKSFPAAIFSAVTVRFMLGCLGQNSCQLCGLKYILHMCMYKQQRARSPRGNDGVFSSLESLFYPRARCALFPQQTELTRINVRWTYEKVSQSAWSGLITCKWV